MRINTDDSGNLEITLLPDNPYNEKGMQFKKGLLAVLKEYPTAYLSELGDDHCGESRAIVIAEKPIEALSLILKLADLENKS